MALRIDPRALAELGAALDAKIRPKKGAVQSNHLAQVTRVDPDGTVWVHIFGGADETPVNTTLSTVNEGDMVNAIISEGKVTVNGNASSPSASTAYVNKVNRDTAETAKAAIAAVLGDIVQIKRAIIDQATVDELLALNATVQTLVASYANISELVAAKADIAFVDANFANIDFANVDALDVGTAKIVEILANSGVFKNLVYADGSVTGQLDAVTVNGDLINANTIRANRIIFQGTDSETGEQTGLWYQLNSYGNSDRPVADQLDLSDARYREALDGSHIVAKSITANEVNTESLVADTAFVNALRTVLLLAEAVQVGGMGSTHVEMRGNRFSFFAPGYSYDYATEQDPDYVVESGKAMPGEVAYIAVDEDTNESMFYITRAVVVKDLRFGNWKWYDRSNGNLALKWIGGSV